MNAKTIARFGLLCAVALVLGYVESLFAFSGALVGVKLGLANTVLLFALYTMDVKSAALLMLLKVLLSGLLFAGLSGMLYSFAGGILSLCMMALCKRTNLFSIIGVSVVGAVSHNIGQILVASLLVRFISVLPYVPILLIAAVITGMLTGIAAKSVCHLLQPPSDSNEQ